MTTKMRVSVTYPDPDGGMPLDNEYIDFYDDVSEAIDEAREQFGPDAKIEVEVMTQ